MKKICIKNLIISIFIFLVLTSALFFLNKEVKSNFNKINDSLFQKNKIKEKNDKITLINKSILEIEDDLILLNSHFINNSNIIDFLEEIEKSAIPIGVKAEVVSVKVPDEKNINASIGINASGNFSSIYKFLLLIENSNYELSISSFNISKSYSQKENSKDFDTDWTGNFVVNIISFLDN